MQGPVRGVCRDVGKERLLRANRVPDKLNTIIEEYVTAESLGGDDLAVMPVAAIKIIIIPEIRRLTYSSASVAINLCKAPILRTVGKVIPKMPFAEHSCMVTIILKQLTERNFIFA